MKDRKTIMLACDFETTVYKGQDHTEVWSSAFVEIGHDNDAIVKCSIDETLEYWNKAYKGMKLICYYHNLKFDGSFWVDYLLRHGYTWTSETDAEKRSEHEFTTLISDMGMWYTLTFQFKEIQIELRDSLKLLPFTLKECGKAFQTKHQKLEMKYEGYRYSGCYISPKEQEYIINDVYVLKEALEFMFSQGHKKLTIGSCCMGEFKKEYGRDRFKEFFPDLTKIELCENIYGAKNADEYIRKSYHGGWCYVVPEKTNKAFKTGVTADVNSLYPSMMHSESGNYYPVGKPDFWVGNYIPEKAKSKNHYYFITFNCAFRIKYNFLPFIQIKGSGYYKATEMLTDSRPSIHGHKVGSIYLEDEKRTIDDHVTLTMTQTDYSLFLEHYDVFDLKILHGCYFWNELGIFDEYINKYKKLKIESAKNGNKALKTLSKLFLNNCYGKFATSDDSSYQVPFLDPETNSVKFRTVCEYNKKAGYIAIGSAITSYARNFTIRSAQQNYYGAHEHGFIYADTDSIHCDLLPSQIKGIRVHPTDFCCWKLESTWDKGIFLRQKTYIEHVIQEDLNKVDKPYYNVKCAGMPDVCKNKFINHLENGGNLADFKQGLEISGKLRPRHIQGGVILEETTYKIR